MACPDSNTQQCEFAQFLVDETPVFDKMIMEDIRLTDSWVGNVSVGTMAAGTPPQVTQDRFRSVFPNTAKPWTEVASIGPGCDGNPCDPAEAQIGWGSDRLTFGELTQNWTTPLQCYDQLLNVTQASEQIQYIISNILRPATTDIFSMFARKQTAFWSKYKTAANSLQSDFTYQWNLDANGDESYFDASVPPSQLFKLVPQMLQNNWSFTMRDGYGGKNPFVETAPFVELVTDMDTAWSLEKLGGQQGVGGGSGPSVIGNWRFEQFAEQSKYWRYGFNGSIGNYLVRVDEMGLRFNYMTDLGAAANGGNGNRYRYQLVLPYTNSATTGAGGASGLGSNPNADFDRAQYAISFQSHKMGLEFLVADSTPINPEMPFVNQEFGGKWRFLMNNLGEDVNGVAISNKWGNKGQFGARFKYYVRPKHYEFLRVYFHKREQFCIPEIDVCSASPGYPAQSYASANDECPATDGVYGTGVPTTIGPVPSDL